MKILSVALTLVLIFRSVAAGSQMPPVPTPRMNIVVLEGEGAINHVRKRQPVDIVVQVRDGNRNPLSGATVNFAVPLQGPGGDFNGSKTLTLTTDQQGRATARGFRPNSAVGKVEIRVSASSQQETASIVLTQFNMAVTGTKGSGKWIALAGILGGAAAGGAYYAATRKSVSPTAPPAAIGISPGAGTVGRP